MSLSGVLSSVLHGQIDFCCLCFGELSEHRVYLNDEVVVNSQDKPMSQVLFSVLGEELSSMTTFGLLCNECAVSAVKLYKFRMMCKNNSETLSNAVRSLEESFQNTLQDCDDYKTLFVSLNLNDFTSKQLYDDMHLDNIAKAHKRYSSIVNTETQPRSFKIASENKTLPIQVKNVKTKGQIRKQHLTFDIPSILFSDIVANNSSSDYKCKVCLKSYPEKQKLRFHYFKKHYPRNVKCSKCPRSFISVNQLTCHIEEHHNAGVCSECGKHFTNKYVLRKHEMNHNIKIICQECGRVYRSKEAFKKHITDDVCRQKMKKSSKEGAYQCDICKKHYCYKPYLAKHIKYEHGNSEGFKCKFCSKQFYSRSRLQTHIVKHTHEKNFLCTICDGRFVTKASLLYHTRLHTGEKPYQCEHCDKAFLSASRRLDHVRRHHLAPSLECDICHGKFKASSSLLKHRRRHFNPNSRLNSNRRFYPGENANVESHITIKSEKES